MHLELKKTTIRNWDLTDAQSLTENANNRNVWINLRDTFPHPYIFENAVEWLSFITNIEDKTIFAIEHNGKAIGGIGYHPQEDVQRFSAEIGYWIGEEHWNKGIISEVLPEFCDFIFNTTEIIRLYAFVYEWNAASSKVLEKSGFTCEGILKKYAFKDGKFLDAFLYAKVKN